MGICTGQELSRYTRILYYKQEAAGSGLDDDELLSVELKFWESQKSCGSDNGGCNDLGLARVCQQVSYECYRM